MTDSEVSDIVYELDDDPKEDNIHKEPWLTEPDIESGKETGDITHWLRNTITPRPGGSGANQRTNEQIELIKGYKFDKFDNDPSHVGYIKKTCPSDIFKLITDHWNRNRHNLKMERSGASGDNGYIYNIYKRIPPSLITCDQEKEEILGQHIGSILKPVVEEWCGTEISQNYVAFGPRAYLNGTILHMHVDRIETHAIGIIICVDHDLTEPWPLTIQDRKGEYYEFNPSPGEMILYEACRLPHGRLKPLCGRYCVNYFLHYKPTDWLYKPKDVKTPFVGTPVYQIKWNPTQSTNNPLYT